MTMKVKMKGGRSAKYLLGVHLELANDLDSYLVQFSSRIFGAINVAKGAISHFIDERPALQTRVCGHSVTRFLGLFRSGMLFCCILRLMMAVEVV